MKYNVLQLLDSFNQGGTERQTVQLVRLLHESNRFQVHVASLSGEGVLRNEVERLGYTEIPSFPLTSFYNRNAVVQLHRLSRLMRERRIDLVHAHDFYTNIFGIAAATLAQIPVRIASRRETDGIRTAAQRRLERTGYRAAHALVANAEAVREHLIEEGVPAAKVTTIYNGLDVARLKPQANLTRDEALAVFNLPAGRRFVAVVANMRHVMKDQATFLRAAQIVNRVVPDAGFVLAGEGEQMPSLKQLAKELGLEADAFFLGRCARVADLMQLCEIGVLSSRGVEGFSNSIIEYMAVARPVVATDVGGAREAIVDGETGFIVPPGDAGAMAERLITLLKDSEQSVHMGARGRERVEAMFSCQAQLERVEGLYDKLLEQLAPRERANKASESALSTNR